MMRIMRIDSPGNLSGSRMDTSFPGTGGDPVSGGARRPWTMAGALGPQARRSTNIIVM